MNAHNDSMNAPTLMECGWHATLTGMPIKATRSLNRKKKEPLQKERLNHLCCFSLITSQAPLQLVLLGKSNQLQAPQFLRYIQQTCERCECSQ